MMKLLLVAITLLAAAVSTTPARNEPKSMHPVLLIPGMLGNRMEAKLDKKEVPKPSCKKQADWSTIWFDASQLTPESVDCFVDNFRLDSDPGTGMPIARPGVEIRVPGFGDTSSVEYIDPMKSVNGYMDKLVEALVTKGYKRGSSIRAAPYDSRLAPNHNKKYQQAVKDLTEKMYADAGNKRVILLSHAAGSRILYYFLTQQTPEWKDKHVARWITSAGSLGGDVGVLSTLSAGFYEEPRALSKDMVRTLFRSFSNLVFQSPDPLVFEKQIIFQLKDKNFTASQLMEVFEAIGHQSGIKQLAGTRSLITKLDAPGVQVSCIYGSKVPTIEKIVYETQESLLDGAKLIRGEGDGSVNRASATACQKWKATKGFESKEYEGIKHLDLIRDSRVVQQIEEIVSRVNKE